MNSNRILIIDQDATFIQTVSNYFKSIGIEVYSTADGIEGYRMAKEAKPGVVILDTELPNLNSYNEIAIDLETCDPNLNHHMGSGAVIQEGKVVGISVATNDYCRYFPLDHEGGGNMEPTRVLPWFRDLLKNNAVKIAAPVLKEI